jgi:membrane protein YqaA with SNARE-associated domain
MYAYDVMVLVSIVCVVGFTAVIYVDDDLPLALGLVAVSIVGTVAGGVLGYWLLPFQKQFAMIFSAFGGGIALVLLMHHARRAWFPR